MIEVADRDVTVADAAVALAVLELKVSELRRSLLPNSSPSGTKVMDLLRQLDQLKPLTRYAARQLLELGKDRGATWEQLGSVFVPVLSRSAAQSLYRRCGGTKCWQTANSALANGRSRFDLLDSGEE